MTAAFAAAFALALLLARGRAEGEGAAPVTEERAVARARGLLAAGDAADGARLLEETIARSGAAASREAYYWLAECRRDLLDTEGALRAMSEARRRAPDDVGVALALGNLHFVRREMDLAAALYRDVLRLSPQDAAAQENLAAIARERDAVLMLRGRRRIYLAALLFEALALTGAVALVCRVGGGGRREAPRANGMAAGRSGPPRL